MKSTRAYLRIISRIEKVRSQNNINWMDLLRIAFRADPANAKKCMRRINAQDRKIAKLLKQLSS